MSTIILNYNFTTEQINHTQTNEPLQVVKILDKLSKEAYITLNKYIKTFGGYYSKFVKGFIVPTDAEILKGEEIEQAKKESILPLFERCKFIPTEHKTDKSEYKFVGCNYETDLTCKDIAKIIRMHLKSCFPECKFSVTSDYDKINVNLKESPYNYSTPPYDSYFESHQYKGYEAKHNYIINAILDYVKQYVSSYNFDDSDSMTDYFHVKFWDNISISSHDYIQTAPTTEQQEQIEQFVIDRTEHEKAEAKRKEQEHQAEQEKREDIAHAIISKNITITELSELEQYIYNDIMFANLNKLNTLEEYKAECNNGEYNISDVKITREIHFTSLETLNTFNNMFLHDFDFLANSGGSYTNDIRIQSMIDYSNMNATEQETVKWDLYGIAVYFENKLQYIIDTQGYSYSRYVGITSENTAKQAVECAGPLTVEQEQNRQRAEIIEDISGDIITDLSLKPDEWQNSKEYKQKIIETLEQHSITLDRPVIQQITIEELKIYLYDLLQYMHSVRYQFNRANLKQGAKITLFSLDGWGLGVTTQKMTFNSFNNITYAQYTDAVQITFTLYKEHSQRGAYLHSNNDFIIVDGWHDIPESILYEITEEDGWITKTSKYGLCDKQQTTDVKNYITGQNLNVLIDRTE